MQINSIEKAIRNLAPNAYFAVGGSYDTLKWFSRDIVKPTKEQVLAEQKRLLDEWTSTEYQRKRAAEYPPMADYLDAVVKGGTAQVQAYIDKCKAVKAKYPKPIK